MPPLAPAYLLTGPDLASKQEAVLELALQLNCTANDHRPCGLCLNCKWISSHSHPSIPIYLRAPETSARGEISVEAVSQFQEAIYKTSDDYKIAVIEDASLRCLVAKAANKLLKTIEEPPPRTVFFLFAADRDLVLDTIVSRCQERYIPGPIAKTQTLSAEAQEIWDLHSADLLKSSSRADLICVATRLSKFPREALLEFWEAMSNHYSDLLSSSDDKLFLAQKILAIEEIKTDIQNFVKADMAIYHSLK